MVGRQGEENSFGRWTRVRGWVTPPHVTPHYWTAAEMALLQMDMLGYLDERDGEPVLVIGGEYRNSGSTMKWMSKAESRKCSPGLAVERPIHDGRDPR